MINFKKICCKNRCRFFACLVNVEVKFAAVLQYILLIRYRNVNIHKVFFSISYYVYSNFYQQTVIFY